MKSKKIIRNIHAANCDLEHRPKPGIFSLFTAVVKQAEFDAQYPPTDTYSKTYYGSIYCPKKFLKEWRQGTLRTKRLLPLT